MVDKASTVGERKALDNKASLLMVGICMIWGLQQIVLKMAAADISPVMQIALRSGISLLLVYPLVKVLPGTKLFSKQFLVPGFLVALLFSLEFVLVAEALRLTSASHTVVLLYTAPIFVALGLHWKLPAERLNSIQWIGIFTAFLGIVFTFLGKDNATESMSSNMLLGDFLALLAGISWALTTITLRLTRLSDVPATQTLFYQLLGGFIFLLIIAFASGQATIHWTPIAIGSLVFHSLLMSFASLMIWFWLLRNYLASQLGVFSFLTPIFGIVFSVILLNEKIEQNFIFGTLMVMLGVMIVSLHQWIRKRFLMLHPLNKATLLGFSSIFIWASLVAVVKLITESLSPILGVALIYSFSAICILVLNGLPKLKLMPKTYLWGCGALFVLYEILFLSSVALSQNREQVLIIAMINYLWPPLTIVFSIFAGQLNYKLPVILGFIIALFGLMMVVNPQLFDLYRLLLILQENPLAYAFAFIGALLWPCYSVLTKKYAEGHNAVPVFLW